MEKLSQKLQPLFWSKDIKQLDLKKDEVYIIHQILSYGRFSHLRWLFRTYPKGTIREVFINHPKKIYQQAVFYFVKNFILGLKNKKLDEKKYLKTALRDIQRKSKEGL